MRELCTQLFNGPKFGIQVTGTNHAWEGAVQLLGDSAKSYHFQMFFYTFMALTHVDFVSTI